MPSTPLPVELLFRVAMTVSQTGECFLAITLREINIRCFEVKVRVGGILEGGIVEIPERQRRGRAFTLCNLEETTGSAKCVS